MLRKPLLTLLGALALAAAFFYGVAHLFVLRYEKGDLYPAYSSLRADPLGVKGLHDALDQLPGVAARRNFRPLPRLRPAAPVTLVYAGITHHAYWEDRELREFDALVRAGSRAIFAFAPFESTPRADEEKRAETVQRTKKKKAVAEGKKPRPRKLGAKHRAEEEKKDAEEKKAAADQKADKKKSGKEDKKGDEENDEETIPTFSFGEVAKRWGLAFDYLPADQKLRYDRRAVSAEATGALEPEISWHSALCFKDLQPEWRVLYRCGDQPVVIERALGHGTIVLAADAYFLSNEAMRNERPTRLLSRIFSGPPDIVFDEEHLDVRDSPGIAALARKYRLQGVVAGLLALAVLFVWKNAVRFIPAYRDDHSDGDVVIGKESAEGFVNLLRRTIKPSEILAVCLAEWRKAATHRPAERARVEELFAQEQDRPAKQRDPVSTYRQIAQTLTRH